MRDLNAFYRATREANFKTASDVCLKDKNAHVWPDIIRDSIRRFDVEWSLDQISLEEVSGAFWTTRRVLDFMLARGVPVTGSMRETGRILLCVPKLEQHSFGARLLADQLRRAGYHVDLLTDRATPDIFRHLQVARFDILGMSIGYDESLLGLADVIAEARRVSKNPHIRVALGGSLFNGDVAGYGFLNADVVVGATEDPMAYFRDLTACPQSPEGDRHV